LSSRNLPQHLTDAIESILASRKGTLRERTSELREAYGRAASSSNVSIEAYLATRLPATYAAISRVFELVVEVTPDFSPRSFLDIGAGPGTASWAAIEFWPKLVEITMVERDNRFADLAKTLAATSAQLSLKNVHIVRTDLDEVASRAELVVAAYVFAEQSAAMAAKLARHLWEVCDGTLIIVEPGTPEGFERIRAARVALLAAGALMVGPCPHSRECPMTGTDWCHFKTRLQRSRIHMQAKNATVPFEDESFSFVAVSRVAHKLPRARIIAPPAGNKVGTTLKLCTHGGIDVELVASRNRPVYKLSKKKNWGDSWEEQ
jgi:ribosomal protein RSM22 (predicted rRNA methylase)